MVLQGPSRVVQIVRTICDDQVQVACWEVSQGSEPSPDARPAISERFEVRQV